jgi:hypothetical protein
MKGVRFEGIPARCGEAEYRMANQYPNIISGTPEHADYGMSNTAAIHSTSKNKLLIGGLISFVRDLRLVCANTMNPKSRGLLWRIWRCYSAKSPLADLP